MEHIDIYKGPTRGAFSLMTTDERIKIFKRIFSYFRSKEFRLVSKFFCSLYDNYSKDEDAKLDGVEGDIEKLYSSFKDSILDRTVNNKNYQTKLDQQLWRFKDNILALKKAIKENLGGNNKGSTTEYSIKENIFQLPLSFYSGIIKNLYFNDTKKTMDLDTIALNRNDYEWMKELRQKIGQGKQMTFQCFNGDLVSIHKSLLSIFKTEFDEDVDTIDENEYAFLSDKAEFGSDTVDFTDKGALLKRQREILKEIEEHTRNKDTCFNPFSVLLTGLGLWFIILCQGGKFCIAKIEKNQIVEHKSDSKYVQRKKAGKRQMNFDKKSSCMTSVGSQMRRANERIHQEHIQEYLEEYKEDLEKAEIIFLNAPGMNKLFFIGPDKPLREMRHKVRTLAFNMKKANYTEVQGALEELTEVKIVFNKSN